MGARGGEYFISKPRWSSVKIYAPGGPSSGQKGNILFLEIVYFYIFWEQRSCDGSGNESKKTGARSARARTRGQNPLVKKNSDKVNGKWTVRIRQGK